MSLQEIRQKSLLAVFLRSHPALYLYHLGDLDDFYWPQTSWFGWVENQNLEAVLLVYKAFRPHIALTLAAPEHEMAMRKLLAAAVPRLPDPVYFHISPGLTASVEQAFAVVSHGLHLRMRLANPLSVLHNPSAVPLSPADLPAIQQLLAQANPENAFDPALLPTGHFFGIWEDGYLASMAGIHVHSPEYRVAALGSVATLPAHRGKGLARQTTAAVIHSLLPSTDEIGLNVRADNTPAVRLYQSLGFSKEASYYEWMAWQNQCPVSGS